MNVEEYISSGILESYALGSCSTQEVTEVERLIIENDSIREEVRLIQDALEQIAFKSSVPPPVSLKSKIWNTIREEEAPVIRMQSEHARQKETTVPVKRANFSWMGYAASFALIIAASAFAVYFYTENQKIQDQLLAAKGQNDILQQENRQSSESLKTISAHLNLLADAGTKKVTLAGAPAFPDSRAVVFWNEKNKQVMLGGIALPKAPEDKQYQLWALVDGVPVDAGVFDDVDTARIFEMKSVDRTQAFAITLEPKGGSPSPHLEALYVIGNV